MTQDARKRELTDNDKRVMRDIRRYGCHIVSVFDPKGRLPFFSYSIGIQHSCNASDAIVLCFGVATCSGSPPRPVPETVSRLMPDGKRWMLTNLSLEMPGSYCYDDDASKCARYGRLYTWAAARQACSSLGGSWRLPSMEDWRELARAYGGLFCDGADQDGGRKTSAHSVRCVAAVL